MAQRPRPFFLLQLTKRALEGDDAAARILGCDRGSQRASGRKQLQVYVIVRSIMDPGSVTSALEPLRMAKKLDPYRETARIALEPRVASFPEASTAKGASRSAFCSMAGQAERASGGWKMYAFGLPVWSMNVGTMAAHRSGRFPCRPRICRISLDRIIVLAIRLFGGEEIPFARIPKRGQLLQTLCEASCPASRAALQE
jgi:hypothetical protein